VPYGSDPWAVSWPPGSGYGFDDGYDDGAGSWDADDPEGFEFP
jgi:hypothetical protein